MPRLYSMMLASTIVLAIGTAAIAASNVPRQIPGAAAVDIGAPPPPARKAVKIVKPRQFGLKAPGGGQSRAADVPTGCTHGNDGIDRCTWMCDAAGEGVCVDNASCWRNGKEVPC